MASKKFVFFSAVTGNILEYYDFTVYSVFIFAISKNFFPATSELAQTLSALAVFALGFVTRPLGGILFGYIGDKYGRKFSLICSMVGMTIPTFIIGLLPSYEDIGVFAPIILIIMRLMQGLCISGEGTGSAIFVLEHNNKFKPGFITGFINATNIIGTLIASLIGIFINSYFAEVESAWRFAFFLGGLFGIVSFYLRLRTSETPIFLSMIHKNKIRKSSFLEVIKISYKSMILTFSLGGLASLVVYIIKAYVNVFYSNLFEISCSTSLWYTTYTSIILMICMPLSGLASDIFGKTRVILSSCLALIILIIPTFVLMGSEDFTIRMLALTSLGILAGSIAGSAYNFVICLFAPEHRFSGVGFSYNLGVAAFGGTSPMVSKLLVAYTGLYYAPAFYIMLVTFLFMGVLYFLHIKKTIKTKSL